MKTTYLARSKQTNIHFSFEWTENDELIINNVSVDPNDYEIVEVELISE